VNKLTGGVEATSGVPVAEPASRLARISFTNPLDGVSDLPVGVLLVLPPLDVKLWFSNMARVAANDAIFLTLPTESPAALDSISDGDRCHRFTAHRTHDNHSTVD